jgi:hypothetical protein
LGRLLCSPSNRQAGKHSFECVADVAYLCKVPASYGLLQRLKLARELLFED